MTFANVYRKAASGAGTIDRLTTDNTFDQESLDWSRDGRFLLYTQNHFEFGDHGSGKDGAAVP